jgi:hypothetical protein
VGVGGVFMKILSNSNNLTKSLDGAVIAYVNYSFILK